MEETTCTIAWGYAMSSGAATRPQKHAPGQILVCLSTLARYERRQAQNAIDAVINTRFTRLRISSNAYNALRIDACALADSHD